jgi:hypothetical protein
VRDIEDRHIACADHPVDETEQPLRLGQSGRRFIQHKHARPMTERPNNLEPLFFRQCEIADERLRRYIGRVEFLQDLGRSPLVEARRGETAGPLQQRRQQQVGRNAQIGEEAQLLEGGRNAGSARIHQREWAIRPPVQHQASRIGGDDPAEDFDKG